jgi:hypothetical protein
MRVGVVLKGKTRKKDVELMKEHFEVNVFEIPSELPEFIEEPETFLQIPEEFFDVDMVVSYAVHPDINLELIRLAGEKGVGLVVLSGGSKAGSYIQLKKEGERRGVRVVWEEICCATPKLKDEKYSEFFEYFGMPEFEVKISDDRIEYVEVKRSAFCGATFFVAEKIKGLDVNSAPSKAGYFTQIFPCYASRGIDGGIHKAARVHKKAVEKAIERAKEKEK